MVNRLAMGAAVYLQESTLEAPADGLLRPALPINNGAGRFSSVAYRRARLSGLSAPSATYRNVNAREWKPCGDAWLRGLVRIVAGAGIGERNSVLFWASCRAGEARYATARQSRVSVTDVLIEAAGHAGLSAREAARTVGGRLGRRLSGRPQRHGGCHGVIGMKPSPRDSEIRAQGGMPPPYEVHIGTLIAAVIAVAVTAILIWLL
jgi:hypothetical protein